MSCWVVPAIAAEIWGVPVDQVLERIENGSAASKTDEGFLFVDVAPESPEFVPPRLVKTYTLVNAESPQVPEDDPQFISDEPSADWRKIRSMVGRTRQAPIAA